MSRLREGWYWVRDRELTHGLWSPEYVWANGLIKSLATTVNAIEMGPRIPSPDEPFAFVPVEPTQEMIEEGAKAIVSWDEGCDWPKSWGADADRHRKDCRKSYHAMLSAAPNP